MMASTIKIIAFLSIAFSAILECKSKDTEEPTKGFGGYVGSDSMGGIKDGSSFGYGNLKDISYKNKLRVEKEKKKDKDSIDDLFFDLDQLLASSGTNGNVKFGQRLDNKKSKSQQQKSIAKIRQKSSSGHNQRRVKTSGHSQRQLKSSSYSQQQEQQRQNLSGSRRQQKSSDYSQPIRKSSGNNQQRQKSSRYNQQQRQSSSGNRKRQQKSSGYSQPLLKSSGRNQQKSYRFSQRDRSFDNNQQRQRFSGYNQQQQSSSGYGQDQTAESGHGQQPSSRQQRNFSKRPGQSAYENQPSDRKNQRNRQQLTTANNAQPEYEVRYSIELGADDPSAAWWVQQEPLSAAYDLRLQHGYGASSNVYFNLNNDH